MCDPLDKTVILARSALSVPDAPLRQVGPVHDDKRAANKWLDDSDAIQDPNNGDKFYFAWIIDVQEVEIQRVLKRSRKVATVGEVGAEPVAPSAQDVTIRPCVTTEVEQ